MVCETDGSALRDARPNIDALIGKVINGRYRILEKLGEGGMSIVYVAEQINIGRKVALKIMHGQYSTDLEFVRRFRQEARLAASLSHPNIVQVYDFDQAEDGTLFIAMEYLRGTNLKDLIRQGPLDVATAVRAGIQIADGLASAHRAGVIHRDIKPENIMVLHQNQQIRLLDFGIARLGDPGSTTKLTRAGMMMGTPAYMAPEQIEGSEVTERTDIYALGIVLYEMLCGVAPFRAPTPAAVLMKHLKEIAPAPRKLRNDIPVAVERIITQAMEKRPERRQANADEIVTALRSARAKLPAQFSGTAYQPTEFLDAGDIDPTIFATPERKGLLDKFGSLFNRQRREKRGDTIADRSAHLSSTRDLSDTAGLPGTSATVAETVVVPEPLTSTRRRRLDWKLAVGAGLVALLGIGIGAFYRHPTQERVQITSIDVAQESPPSVPRPKIRSVGIVGNQDELLVGQQARYAVNIEGESGAPEAPTEEISWESSNPWVLNSTGKGEFIAKSAGTTEIAAEYQGVKSAPFRVTVKDTPQSVPIKKVEVVSIMIEPSRADIDINQRVALRITGKYSDGKERELKGARWHNSNETVADIRDSGELEGKRTGTARITATYGGLRSTPMIVSVRSPQVKAVPVPAKETPRPAPTRASPTAELGTGKPSDHLQTKEAPVQKAIAAPQGSIAEYIKSAKKHRDQGDYAAAVLELDKAKRIDQTNQQIQDQIAITTRACNAERILVRPDLKC
jgi:serine/threonine protein kinase